MKDDLDGKIVIIFVGLTAKTDSYLICNCSQNEKAKGTKSVS